MNPTMSGALNLDLRHERWVGRSSIVRLRPLEGQRAKVQLACRILNTMTCLVMPDSYRTVTSMGVDQRQESARTPFGSRPEPLPYVDASPPKPCERRRSAKRPGGVPFSLLDPARKRTR